MKSTKPGLFDTPLNNCSTERDKMSLDSQGDNMQGVLNNNILIEILTPLLEYPGLISFLDEQIADELCDRGFFCIGECAVTALGRDLLTTLNN